MSNITDDAFRDLREAWFNHVLSSHTHEKDWTDEKTYEERLKQNAKIKAKYDWQTEEILCGICRKIAPRCAHDLMED